MWAQLINVAIGIWLMAAPDVLGYGGIAADHDRIVGPLVATFACVACWEATRPLRWVNLPVGAWMLLAPWLLGFPSTATIDTMLCGIAVACLSLVRGKLKHRFDGGWAALWRPGTAASINAG
jgi:hypothetical protein